MRTTIIIYGILIGALTGYWYYLRQDCRVSEQILEHLGKIQTDNNKILRRFAEGCYRELDEKVNKFHSLETTPFFLQAEKIHSLTTEVQTTSDTDSLSLLHTALRHETRLLFENDQPILDSISTQGLSTAAKVKYHSYISDYQRARIYRLEGRAMQSLRDSARVQEAQNWDFLPEIMNNTPCMHPGDTCKMLVFGSKYLSQPDYLEMYINGHPIPVERGIGRWTTTFNKPGEVKIETEIHRKNPFTGEILHYKRTITNSICPNNTK